MSPPSQHHGPALASAASDKSSVACAACGCCCHVQGSHILVQPLLESLRSDLQEFIESRIEKVLHPLSVEASTIKLWLARVANHLERVEPTCEDPLGGLFGPCSPVQRSPTLALFTTSPAMSAADRGGQKIYEATEMDVMPTVMEEEQLQAPDLIPEPTAVEDHIKLDAMSLQSTEVKEHLEPIMVHMLSQVVTSAEEGFDVATARQSITKDPGPTIISEIVMAVKSLATTTSCEQPKVPPLDVTTKQMVQQVDTCFEDVVLVEDASDDEEVVPTPIEDPIFLITIEDVPTLSTVVLKEEEARGTDDPSTEAVSSPTITALNGEDDGCPPMLPPSSASMTARRQRKSYDRTSVRRSARLAQRGVLKELGIIGSDGNLNDDAIQDYADRLKEILPPEHLKPLARLKGHAFLDLLVEVSCFL
ncbi:unnamed protein product [Urochloa decumbens]|uniref:Uncharacterized protein n=1 Tax=Urochloa decumbens TaxID=240449 RepID=A0ABC9DTB8_9POAL